MRDLRLVGVHDDGEHLVATDDDGQEYRIRIDDQLRAAARRDRPRLGQLQIEIDGNVRPRDVQAMIRAGASAEEVAARTGWDLDKIARFEGPVLAEREHIASAARRVRMRGQSAGANETLGGRASGRLAQRGVDQDSVDWDAARDADGQWTVTARFTAGGKERAASWWFDVAGMSVVAKNDEARWLSEADTPQGAVPTAHRPTAVFDVEADDAKAAQRGSDELTATMRESARGRRRGRRKSHSEPVLPIGEDESGSDAAGEPGGAEADGRSAQSVPPAARGTHPADLPQLSSDDAVAAAAPEQESAASGPEAGPATAPSDDEERTAGDQADTRDEPAPEEPTNADGTPGDGSDQPATDPDEASEDGALEGAADNDTAEMDTADDDAKPEKDTSKRRKGRASVPSWDDVMFGGRRGKA
ncbi:septation protein SepH [Marihabitans asiaticum]|uniref:DUF3071 family protein n=1 Tax=Marihabitans asiaticum TaxID=415218 RepID=A0A560W6V9_9MICO|nr:septation protein SepH [Marihabitans asiaticum]TWD13352.1 DUF3071 family protein [Marihabitans asiaticum]